MGVADQIIARIDHGEDPQQLATQVTWGSIPPPERQKLFAEAQRRSSQTEKPDALIWALYRMATRAQEAWDSLRALALLIRRPDFPLDRKQKALGVMRTELDKLAAKINQQDAPKIQQYKLCEADYYALRGQVVLEAGSDDALSQAIECYSQARGLWERYHQIDQATWARQQVEALQGILDRQEALLPLDSLRDERSTLLALIEDLNRQVETSRAAMATAEESKKEKAAEVMRLGKQIESIQAELESEKSKLSERRQSITYLDAQIREREPALHFLMALSRAATAPLWVEVVRVALDQGEIDDFTRQALERLALVCPAEALPLLAEIAARAPEPFRLAPGVFEGALENWMAGIAQARVLMPTDLQAAARCLVDSWTTFFANMAGATADA